jgi:hypothetical protein
MKISRAPVAMPLMPAGELDLISKTPTTAERLQILCLYYSCYDNTRIGFEIIPGEEFAAFLRLNLLH